MAPSVLSIAGWTLFLSMALGACSIGEDEADKRQASAEASAGSAGYALGDPPPPAPPPPDAPPGGGTSVSCQMPYAIYYDGSSAICSLYMWYAAGRVWIYRDHTCCRPKDGVHTYDQYYNPEAYKSCKLRFTVAGSMALGDACGNFTFAPSGGMGNNGPLLFGSSIAD